MERHPEIDVDVLTSVELASLLGAAVEERSQLTCWPLSLVEEVRTAAGARWIYKAQRLMPVEPALYRAAAGRTQLLPQCRILTDDGVSSTMLLEHLGSPITAEDLTAIDVVALCRSVVDAIGRLPDGLPSHLDW